MEMQEPALSANEQLNNHWTGDGPAHLGTYIGDFPEYPLGPVQQPTIVPVPQKLHPTGLPTDIPWTPVDTLPWHTIAATSTYVNVSPWRVTLGADLVTASVDVPGVKLEDLTVELENGIIKAHGKRFDTGEIASFVYVIGTDYDPATSDASLESGVLTVTVRKFKDKVTHKVNVKAR